MNLARFENNRLILKDPDATLLGYDILSVPQNCVYVAPLFSSPAYCGEKARGQGDIFSPSRRLVFLCSGAWGNLLYRQSQHCSKDTARCRKFYTNISWRAACSLRLNDLSSVYQGSLLHNDTAFLFHSLGRGHPLSQPGASLSSTSTPFS